MGTNVSVLLPRASAGRAVSVASMFEAWEDRLSRFRPESELSRLNRAAGNEVIVGELLFDVVTAAVMAAEATDGLFDPTLLLPLVAAGYDRTFEEVARRSAARTAADPAAPGTSADPGTTPFEPGRWREVRLDPRHRSIVLPPGLGLDLGGIAKGMAVDAAVRWLAAEGLQPVAVEAGGDLATHGTLAGGWPVDVETGPTTTTVAIDRGALATSTVARRRWVVDGEVRHHLLDPRTGRPATTNVWSVTVAAASCREAEVAAKVALILGATAGRRFLERLGLAGLITTTRGDIRRVGPWPAADEGHRGKLAGAAR
jgi:thiamine biosynthesis lipoprotein